MQLLEVGGAVRRIYIYIYVIRWLKVKLACVWLRFYIEISVYVIAESNFFVLPCF